MYVFEEIEGGGEGVVGAAFEVDGAWGGGGEERGENGLEDEGGGAGGADGEVIAARFHFSGAEFQLA